MLIPQVEIEDFRPTGKDGAVAEAHIGADATERDAQQAIGAVAKFADALDPAQFPVDGADQPARQRCFELRRGFLLRALASGRMLGKGLRQRLIGGERGLAHAELCHMSSSARRI